LDGIEAMAFDKKRATSPTGEVSQNEVEFIHKLFGIAL
jgi:hypothetical protein